VVIRRVKQQFEREQLQQCQGFVAGGLVAPPNGRRPVAADLCGAPAVGIQRPGRLQCLLAAHPDGHQFAQPAELQSHAAAGAPRNAAGRPAVRNPAEVRKTAASSASEEGPATAGEAATANG